MRSNWKLQMLLRYFSVVLLLLRFRCTRNRRSIAHTNEMSHVITYGLNLYFFRIRLLMNSRRRKLSVMAWRRIFILIMPVIVLIQITRQELSCHDTILCIRDLRVDGVAVGKHLCGGSCVRVRTSFSRRDRERVLKFCMIKYYLHPLGFIYLLKSGEMSEKSEKS